MNFYILDAGNKLIETIQSPDEEGLGGITALTGIVEEKLETYELLELAVPGDADGLANIAEDMTLIFEDISGWREYVIYEIEDEDGDNFNTYIRAELASSELIDEIIEENYAGISTNPATVLAALLTGTRYSVGHVDSSVYSQSFSVDTQYMNVLEALNEYASKYKAEIRFSYQVDGNQVVNRFVNVYKTYGEYRGKIFEIDRDMTSVRRTVNTELIKTTIIPYSTEQQVNSEDTENAEKYRLDISGVEWSKTNGNPVDKPLGQNYLVNETALENWGKLNPDGTRRHRKISMEFDSDNPETIISMAWVQLGRYTQPRTTYEVTAIDLYAMTQNADLKHEQILLGDTGGVKDHYFSRPIEIQTRLIEVKRDLFDSRNNDYTFGTSKQVFSANSGVEKAEEATRTVEGLLQRIQGFQTSIDGKNKVYRGSDTPLGPLENDIWFRPHPSKPGHTQMLVYNGSTWVIEADSSDLEDAGRLTFGTIDGSEINVINLIADNITGGQLKLETGLEITNNGSPILTVNAAGEVVFNVSKLTIGNRDLDTELDSKAEQTDIDTAVDNIKVGGRNLVTDSKLIGLKGSDDGNVNLVTEAEDSAGLYNQMTASVTGNIYNSFWSDETIDFTQDILPGENYILSIDVNTTQIEDFEIWCYFWQDKDTEHEHLKMYSSTNGQWRRYSLPISVSAATTTDFVFGFDYITAGETISWRNLKIEKGTTASDWTPAPEDVDEKIDGKAGQGQLDTLDGKVNEIESSIPSEESMNYINNALADYGRDISTIETDVSTAKTEVDTLKDRTATVENNFASTTERWNFLDTYMAAGNEGLLISENSSNTGIRIGTDRIDFLDGAGEPVAFITNQLMQINRGIFVQSATVGEHKEETIGDGHTITQWVG